MKRPHGFTLVELLVVIGIVMLVSTLLLSSVSGARKAAQSVVCLGNLRQLAVAAADYATRNDASYPPAQWSDPTDPTISYGWDYTHHGSAGTSAGLLWAGQRSPAVHQCPSFDGRSQSPGDPYTGYNYNTSYIG